MRIAILWTGMSGYLTACLQQLQGHAKLFLSSCAQSPDAPFQLNLNNLADDRYSWSSNPDPVILHERLRRFRPDLILVAGWHVPGYRVVLRRLQGKVPRILCMDNQWLGTPKQWGAVLMSRWLVHNLCDLTWVPGERQAAFAKRLGFKSSAIMRGMYCCDYNTFLTSSQQRVEYPGTEKTFLFAGRFVEAKGIPTLINAYSCYRDSVSDPWSLTCCGTGPFEPQLKSVDGVSVTGFVQPSELPKLFASAHCFIIPSTFEPWGVVVHEACAAGLPILASDAVGSSVHLVQDGFNGYIFRSGDCNALTRLLLRVHCLPAQRRVAMGQASQSLGGQFTPERWAEYLMATADELIHVGLLTNTSKQEASAQLA